MSTTLPVLASPDVAALAFVNDCRQELGLFPLSRLPYGKRLSQDSCPIANGLRASDWEKAVYVGPIPRRVSPTMTDSRGIWVARSETFRMGHRWTIPDRVVEFARGFDAGEYPDYDVEVIP